MKNLYVYLHLAGHTTSCGCVYPIPASLPLLVLRASFRLGGAAVGLPVGSDRAHTGSLPAVADGSVGGSNGPRTTPSTTSLECLRESFLNPILAGIPTPNVVESEQMKARYGLSPVSNGVPHAPYGIFPTIHLDTGRKTSTKSLCPSKSHRVEGRFGPIRPVCSAAFSDTRETAGESPATRFSNTAEYIVRPTETLVSMSLPTKCFPFSKVSRFALAPLGGTAVARETGRCRAKSRASCRASRVCRYPRQTFSKLFKAFHIVTYRKPLAFPRKRNLRGSFDAGPEAHRRRTPRRPLRARALGYRTRNRNPSASK